jgi:hypothetical protein
MQPMKAISFLRPKADVRQNEPGGRPCKYIPVVVVAQGKEMQVYMHLHFLTDDPRRNP